MEQLCVDLAAQPARERLDILGIGIDTGSMAEAIEEIHGFILRREQADVFFCNVHTIMLSRSNERFRRASNLARLALPDGMPLVWCARLMGRDQPGRVSGPDSMLKLCEASVAWNASHFFYGGGDGVAMTLAEKLSARFPGLKVAGTYAPPFRPLTPEEDDEVVEMINASGADMLWVGLGAPKQELWIREHLGRVRSPVLLGVGAAFDFHSGAVKRAPEWMQRHGLEWLSRFMQDPVRLWRRYLVNNPLFLLMFMGQFCGFVDFTSDKRA